MASLHIVNQAIVQSGLPPTLAFLHKDDAILLIGDAVYALMGQTPIETPARLFALSPDLLARGIAPEKNKFNCPVELLDYAGFVSLTETHHPIVSWY